MKIYQVSVLSPNEGRVLHWAASKREAEKAGAAMRKHHETDGYTVTPAEIIPTRTGILRFLNKHFTTDNG